MTDALDKYSIETLTQAFIKLRDEKKERERVFKETLKVEVTNKLDIVSAVLMRKMQAQGITSAPNEFGTPYFSTVSKVQIQDWAAVQKFIADNGLEHWYTKSVSKEGVETYLEEKGQLPPGVNLTKLINLNVRKS